MLLVGVLCSGCVMLATIGAAAEPNAASDWPQWRGPDRNGIAGPGPKLADAWPEGGPKLLWKSEPIACGWEPNGCVGLGGQEGGLGSVTVVGEKAFVYVHWKHKGGTAVITTKDLNELGWMEGVPDDLARKIEDEIAKARADDPRDKRWNARMDEARREAFITNFPATLDPKLVEKYGSWIEKRSSMIWKTHPIEVKAWDDLVKIAGIRDKEFSAYKDLMAEFKKRGIGDGFFYGLQTLADRLNTMSYTYTDTVVCLDVSTGRELWKKEFSGVPSKEMCYVGASGTPAIWESNVYASGSAGLYCLSVKDGAVIWLAKTTFTHSSPLVNQDGVFLMLAEGVTAFDAKTGKTLWTQPKIKSPYSSVASWMHGGKNYLLAGNNSLDPATGEIIWKGTGPCGNLSTPVVCGDIMLDTSYDFVTAFGLAPGKGERLWSRAPGSVNDGSTPVIYKGCVFQTGLRYNGFPIRCRDLKTGDMKWEGNGHNECSSPIAADGKIYSVLGDPFRLIMFRATPEKFEPLGLGSTQDRLPYGLTPSIANGKLFVRLTDCVACYDITAAGNPGAKPLKPAVVAGDQHTIYSLHGMNHYIGDAVSAVDKGDSLEITEENGKVETVRKSDIDDIIKPGMQWKLSK